MRTVLRVVPGVALLAVVAGSLLLAGAGPLILSDSAEILPAPGAPRFGVLMAGAPVRVLETRDGWMRVSVEGWIRSDEESPAPVMPGAVPAPAAEAAQASLSGSIVLPDDGGKPAGPGAALRLVSHPDAVRARLDESRTSCDSRRAPLVEEADRLKEKADKALSTIESTSSAFEAYDEAKRQRRKVVSALRNLDEECRAAEESILEADTVARTLTGPHGDYRFLGVPVGRYLLVATLEEGKQRHVWEVAVDLTGGETTLDLTEDNRTATGRIPTYR